MKSKADLQARLHQAVFNSMCEAMTRVCGQHTKAWQNEAHSCHVDTWMMLMISAIVEDGKQQKKYKCKFDNDSGSHTHTAYTHTPNHTVSITAIHTGELYKILNHIGDFEQQNILRDNYWKNHLPIVPFGSKGGVWDHVRAYAEAKWTRTVTDCRIRNGIHGDQSKFAKHLSVYKSPLMTSIVCSTSCAVCQKKGYHLSSLAAIPIETYLRDESLADGLLATIKAFPQQRHLICQCRGNARKKFRPRRTTLAQLLVVIPRGKGTQYKPMEHMDMGPQHGKYTLTGLAQCNGIHWVCTIKFTDKWYFYNDMTDVNDHFSVVHVSAHTFNNDHAFKNAIYFYIKN
jgi:hypothetical protein